MMGDELREFDWGALVPLVVHPIKVGVIEAIRYLDRPLSPVELTPMFNGEFSLSLVAYHVTRLAEIGAIAAVDRRAVRGVTQTFYFFPKS